MKVTISKYLLRLTDEPTYGQRKLYKNLRSRSRTEKRSAREIPQCTTKGSREAGLATECMKLIDLQSQRKFRHFRWNSCNLFNCYEQINGKNLFFCIFLAWKFFSSRFFHEVDWNQCSITIHTRNIIFLIVINKFHEQIQWTGAARYIKFLFFCLIINFLCENDASINGKHNQGYLHLLLTILIKKCIKRSLLGRKNSFFFMKSSIIYQK